MSDDRIELDVTLKDKASAGLDDIADKAEALEKIDPEVKVTADTRKADGQLEDVADTATRLDKSDTVIKLRAQIDDLKAQTKEAQANLEAVGDKADDTNRRLDKLGGDGGIKTRGNAIADLTGPLGDASGAASDFAGVFDGLGSVAGDIAGKVGLSAVAMESAIGGIGIAVAAAAALWTVFSGNAEKAKQRQKDLTDAVREFHKAMREGDAEEAAAKLVEKFGDGFDAAKKLGLSVDETTAIITGHAQTVEELYALIQGKGLTAYGSLVVELQKANDGFNDGEQGILDYDERLAAVTASLGGAKAATSEMVTAQEKLKTKSDLARVSLDLQRIAIENLKGELSDEQAVLNFRNAMVTAQGAIKEAGHLTEQQMIDAKNAIIDVGTTAGLTDVEIKTEVAKVTATDVNTAYFETQQLINAHAALKMQATIQATIDAEIKAHSGARFGLGPDGVLRPSGGSVSASSAPSSVVNVNMPVGARGVDVVRQVTGHTRRAGRRYGAPKVP